MIIELHNYVAALLCRVFSFFDTYDLLAIQTVNKLFEFKAKKIISENIGKIIILIKDIGYHLGFLLSHKYPVYGCDFSKIFSNKTLPYDILSAVIKSKKHYCPDYISTEKFDFKGCIGEDDNPLWCERCSGYNDGGGEDLLSLVCI